MKRNTFWLSAAALFAVGTSVHGATLTTPSAWWNFDNDGVNDGVIQDQGPNNIDLAVVEFNSLSPITALRLPSRMRSV